LKHLAGVFLKNIGIEVFVHQPQAGNEIHQPFPVDEPDGQRLDPPGNGQWIYLFRPVAVRNPAGVFPEQKDLIKTGYLKSERLVDLSKHNYQLEPNVTFTPDSRWIVFRSNMHGATHVYAVEVEKANPTTRSE